MSLTNALPAAGCLALTFSVFGLPADEADSSGRLAALEAEVARLEAAASEDAWLTEQRAAEIRELVGSVLADADTRANLQDGMMAGWDGHPFLASADGNFLLQLEARMQLRYVLNVQDEGDDVDDDEFDSTRSGFEARCVRFIFSGHVVDPSITYKVQATHNRGGGALILEDAYMQKDFDNGVSLRAGQFRPPFTREAIVSTFRTTAVERAIAHGAIELSRTQGVEAAWQGEYVGLRGSFHDGDENANTPSLVADTEFAFAARAELRLAGSWKQFNDFTGWQGDQFGLLLGAAADYERGEFGDDDPSRADDLRWTLDAQAEFSGAHLFASLGGRDIDPDDGEDIDILIATLEAGLFVTDAVEVFGRFEWGDDDSEDDLMILTMGATRFWKKHDLKWTTDVGYGFEAVTSTFESSGAGWREDPEGSDGQIVVRTQLQLAF